MTSLTTKQKEILYLLYRFRFLNRIQIQKLLNHKTHNRINKWLKELTDSGYIGRRLDTENKINNLPSIYFLKNNGMRFVKKQEYCEPSYISKLYQEQTRSKKFVDQCLLIANAYLELSQKYKVNGDFKFYTRSEYSTTGIIKEIFPFFVFRKGKTFPFTVCEIFPEKPRFHILNRIKLYLSFFTTGEWITQEQIPEILFICPNDEI